MDYRYKQLEQDLSALNNVFSDLGSRLTEAAKDVTANGVLPSEKLIEQILTARTRFESIRTAIHNQAESMLVSPLPKAEELSSIRTISTLLKTAASAEENKFSAEGEQERATNILARVLAITHRETAPFQPLQDFHAKVTELRNSISRVAWPNRHPESESVIGLRHPSTVLLNFVENLDTLEDDKWIALEATITEAYGKPLFVAASRGKLVAEKSSVKAAEPAKPAPAAEKQVERKAAPERPSEKTVASPAVSAPVAKKDAPAGVESSPVAPVPVAPAPVAAPIPVAPAAIAPQPVAAAPLAPLAAAPVAATPITSTTIPPRPPAPAAIPFSEAPTLIAPTPPAPASATSLSALASATELATERKPVGTPSDNADKGRKEPRLAAPPPAQAARTEPTAQEEEQMGDEASRALAGDGSQRPQRWGFWRGNR